MDNEHLEFYRGKRVLITGGLGFIGSNLAAALVELNASVTLLDSMIPAYGACLDHIARIKNRVSINCSDMRDPHSLRHLLHRKQIVFNLAGQVSHVDSMTDPMNDLDINCRSQLSFLECCRTVNRDARIVYTSTRQVYGRPQYLPVNEKHPLEPADVNGINKLAAEMYFQLYARVYQMQCVCLRLTNTYGPRMDLRNLNKGFVGVFLKQALNGEKIFVFGDGTQRRDFNHVEDVVHALLLAGRCPGLVGCSLNLGSDQRLSINEFLHTLRELIEFEWEYVQFPADRKIIDIGDYFGDYSRFHSATGWKPAIELKNGLEGTIAYFRAHPHLVSTHRLPRSRQFTSTI